MISFRVITQFVVIGIFTSFTIGCGNTGSPKPVEVCQPAPDAHTESCWINEKEKFVVRTQADRTKICESTCSNISRLVVKENAGVRDLGFLQGVEEIERFDIFYNPDLETMEGLNSTTSITRRLRIESNPKLQSIEALRSSVESLETSLFIGENDSLVNLKGLNNLRKLNTSRAVSAPLTIEFNSSLETLSGLENLETVAEGAVNIHHNHSLKSIGGLSEITSVDTLIIRRNDKLNDITSLYGLESIGNQFDVSDNPTLPQCQPKKIMQDAEIGGRITVENNGSGECR